MPKTILFLLLAFLFVSPSFGELEVPYLSQRVTDLAQVIDADAEARLVEQLKALETATGAQVAVLTVPDLEGEVIEDYALRVSDAWKLGQKGQDNGVLVLVAPNDRKVRIEVGYGLEGALTDLQSRRIIDGLMVPAFRQGDYGAGIEAAVGSIAGAVRGEPGAVPPPSSGSSGSGGEPIFMLFLLLPFVGSTLATPGRQGWMGWIFLMPFFFIFGMLVFGVKGGLILLALWIVGGAILRLIWPKSMRVKPGARRGGSMPWIITSGGGRGGGFSGGGFSGGGGSFGGGGASGSW